MSAAIDRHRARVAEILGAPAKSTMKVTSSPLPSKGTVSVTDNPVYYGPSINPQTGTYAPPRTGPMSDAEIDKLIDGAAGASAPSASASLPAWMLQTIEQGRDPVPPSSTAYTSPLEMRLPYFYAQPAPSVFTAKNVAIAAGIGVGLGLVVLLARR